MSGPFTSIDLSRLPPPDVVQTLPFEEIVTAMRDDFVARFPLIAGVIDLESEPVRKLIECCAYREINVRARVNDAAKALMLAFSKGTDLDHTGADWGVQRLIVGYENTNPPTPIYEDDERFRRRIQLVLEAYSVAGPSGAYVFHALTADPTLRDATATSPAPGAVTVAIMADGVNPVPTDDQVDIVRDALSAESVRPLTDNVTVAKAAPVPVTIVAELTLYPGPDGAVVAQEARDALAGLIEQNRRLGYDLRRSAIFSRLHVDGVYSVNLTSPATDVIVGPGECVVIEAVSVTVVGRDQ